MRTAVLLIVLASACLAPAAEPREDFLRIDRPLALGYARVQERLEAVRALRPTVGLHLSGGSARAFAHLGVLRRLEEEQTGEIEDSSDITVNAHRAAAPENPEL